MLNEPKTNEPVKTPELIVRDPETEEMQIIPSNIEASTSNIPNIEFTPPQSINIPETQENPKENEFKTNAHRKN